MKHILFLSIFTVAVFSCGGENAKACFEQGNMAACADQCDTAGDQKACAKHTELGLNKCSQEGDLATCAHMCLMAKAGNQVFCDQQKLLCQKAENKTAEACAGM